MKGLALAVFCGLSQDNICNAGVTPDAGLYEDISLIAGGSRPIRPFRAPKQEYFTFAPNAPEFKMPGDIRLVDLFGPEGDELNRPAIPEFTPVRPSDDWQSVNDPVTRFGSDGNSTIPAPGGALLVVLAAATTAVRRRRH